MRENGMKEKLEAEIAALEADLAARKAKLAQMMSEIPTEFHHLTQGVYDKLKAYFA